MDEAQSNPIPDPHSTPNPLVEAIRSELLALVNGPSLETKLSSISHLAMRAHELLLTTLTDPKMIRSNGLSLNGPSSSYVGTYPLQGSGNVIPVSPTQPGPEQFGATAIRQLVNLVPEAIAGWRRAQLEDPAKLVEAIAVAKDRRLDAIASKLEQRLLDLDDDDAEPHAPKPHGETNGSVVTS